MEETLRAYRRALLENERAELTVEKYLHEAAALLDWLNGAELSKEKLLEYRGELQGKFTARTVNNKLSAVNTFLNYLGREDCRVKLLKVQRTAFADESRELTEAEYKRLLEAAQTKGDERTYYVLLTLAGTGIRVSELPFITVSAVCARRAEIRMKGKSRIVIISKELAVKLKGYILRRGIKKGPVFCTASGRALDRTNIYHAMKKLAKLARVSPKKIFPHNLRHLFARMFYAVSKDIARLADVLGHSSIETTRIYIAVTASAHERIIRRMHLIE